MSEIILAQLAVGCLTIGAHIAIIMVERRVSRAAPPPRMPEKMAQQMTDRLATIEAERSQAGTVEES